MRKLWRIIRLMNRYGYTLDQVDTAFYYYSRPDFYDIIEVTNAVTRIPEDKRYIFYRNMPSLITTYLNNIKIAEEFEKQTLKNN